MYQASFSKDKVWDRDSIVSSLVDDIIKTSYPNYPTQPAPQGVISTARFSALPFGKDKFRIAGSPLPNGEQKIIQIDSVSGPNAVEIFLMEMALR